MPKPPPIVNEVAENFEGRHRNLLDIFESRGLEMEDALDPCPIKQDAARPDWRVFSQRIFVRSFGLVQSDIVRHPDQTGPGTRLPIHPQSSAWARGMFHR